MVKAEAGAVALQMEEVATSHRMQAASRSWKRQGKDPPLELPAGNGALPAPQHWFRQTDL